MQVTVTVAGWFKADGMLWEPTDNVSVVSPMAFPTPGGKAPPLGILSVVYQQNDHEGTTTTMTLVLPWLLTSSPTYAVPDLGSAGDANAQTSGTLDNTGAAPATSGTPDYSPGSSGAFPSGSDAGSSMSGSAIG